MTIKKGHFGGQKIQKCKLGPKHLWSAEIMGSISRTCHDYITVTSMIGWNQLVQLVPVIQGCQRTSMRITSLGCSNCWEQAFHNNYVIISSSIIKPYLTDAAPNSKQLSLLNPAVVWQGDLGSIFPIYGCQERTHGYLKHLKAIRKQPSPVTTWWASAHSFPGHHASGRQAGLSIGS